MRTHPALTMTLVWLACIVVYYALPFQLLGQPLSWFGALGQACFLMAFVIGSVAISMLGPATKTVEAPAIDARRSERILMIGSCLAILCLAMDASHKAVFDLAGSYQSRSETAQALMTGQASASTIWFQLGFLLYPAGYVFSVVHIVYAPRLNAFKLALCGAGPIALASLVMGGRMPALYLILLFLLSWRERRRITPAAQVQQTRFGTAARMTFAVAAMAACAYYFVVVFLVRADSVGGASAMFAIAEENWDIGFRGPLSDTLFQVLGETLTYLLFVFSWYLVQGFVIGNHILALYDHALQFGVYGVDLLSALMRRIASDRLADGFDALLEIGAYGFFPSAWGSLFVDFGFAGLALATGWGAMAGLVYRKIVVEQRADWILFGPFFTIGIALSTINTPIGLANGLMIYAWLIASYLLLRRSGNTVSHGSS